MPRQFTTFSVFLASPSDVYNERNIVKNVISELNQTIFKTLNIHLDLLNWEDSTYPSFGEYPQDVINKQIGDDYDIFIGILWSRFGTPTNKADSGTLEEFERAYARLKEKQDIEICLYFKTDQINPYEIDLLQFEKVKNFRKSLKELGGYYWDFNNNTFEKTLRNHLIKLCQLLIERNSQPISLPSNSKVDILNTAEQEDDEGIYDIFDKMEELFVKVTDELNSLNDLNTSQNALINHYTKQLNLNPSDSKARKKIINDFSEHLSSYSLKSKNQFNNIQINLDQIILKFNKFFKIYPEIHSDSNAEDFLALLNGLTHIIQSLPTMKSGISQFLETTKQMPRMTTELNRSKKLMVATIEPFVHYLQDIEINFIKVQSDGSDLLTSLSKEISTQELSQ